jgi:zinc protease
VREELARAIADGFTAEEVESAKRGLLEARRLARAQDSALAARLGMYLFVERTFAWDVDFERRIAALTPQEVQDALRRNIDPAKLAVSKAGDFK